MIAVNRAFSLAAAAFGSSLEDPADEPGAEVAAEAACPELGVAVAAGKSVLAPLPLLVAAVAPA